MIQSSSNSPAVHFDAPFSGSTGHPKLDIRGFFSFKDFYIPVSLLSPIPNNPQLDTSYFRATRKPSGWWQSKSHNLSHGWILQMSNFCNDLTCFQLPKSIKSGSYERLLSNTQLMRKVLWSKSFLRSCKNDSNYDPSLLRLESKSARPPFHRNLAIQLNWDDAKPAQYEPKIHRSNSSGQLCIKVKGFKWGWRYGF